MLKTFSDVKKFLERDDLPPATSTKLLHVLDDPAKTRKLRTEIATTVVAMEPFVKARYKIQGDGPLSLEAYLLCLTQDRVSVNDVAMRTIKVMYNELLDVGCFSHT